MSVGSFFRELLKRKVLQSAAIYGAVAWGVTEVVVTVVEQLFLPQWVSTLAVIGFVVGFPVAMFLAWAFDFTSEGVRRTSVASGRGKASIAVSLLLARHYDQEVRDQQEADVDTLLEAMRLYRDATEADPESALAHSRLAGALSDSLMKSRPSSRASGNCLTMLNPTGRLAGWNN